MPQRTLHSIQLSYLLDETSILLRSIQESNNFIDKHKEGNILVHCVYGQSRSVCIVAAYLIYSGNSLEEALQRVYKMLHC